MNYKSLNVTIGWIIFLIATIVYFITLEDTVSLWDCGEYITAAVKLEVGHPPGAPLFMLFGRLFTAFVDPANAALWINRMSALSSSFSILFMFWSITMLAKKMAQRDGREIGNAQSIAILASGVVGALAYTFTESFWFSAVEGEVYAMSSLFTAAIFWALLKWDEETTMIKHGELSSELRPMRWMVLIMFLFGLAIGVHLLGLLVLPCMAYVIMFNYKKEVSVKTFIITGIIGIAALGFVQNGVIPKTIDLASSMEVAFVNSFGMPFMSGAITFFVLLIAALVVGLYLTRKKGWKFANAAILGLIMLFIGYGSFATIVIRSNANPPLDENNPENLVTLHAYLKREQYGSWPILYGPYWNSEMSKDQSTFGDRSPFYDRRYVVQTRSGAVVKTYKEEKDAKAFVENSGKSYTIDEKYFETNKDSRENQIPTYEQNTLFPRMFYSLDQNKIKGYKSWSGYDAERRVSGSKLGKDGKPIPTFAENLSFFVNYQVDWMYMRYFMWNFAGRQNDIQGHGDQMRGNFKSGFDFIDEMRLGAMGENQPYPSKENPSNNSFYFLPLIFGLIGLFFHYRKAPKDAFVVTLLFLFTGFAILIYLNQKPFEPRERDYAYAASFYAFAIWIGLSVYGLYEAFKNFTIEDRSWLLKSSGVIVGLCALISIMTGNFATMLSAIVIVLIGLLVIYLFVMMNKLVSKGTTASIGAGVIAMIVPIILGVQGWDDHDRSDRYFARDLAYNYLVGCQQNSILFTNGDNDTFPLWYLQEVEEKSTDVRVCNLSLMQTDWYTNQMKMKAYDSDPLPISFTEDQILMYAGNTDQVEFNEFFLNDLMSNNPAKYKEIVEMKIKHNPENFKRAITMFRNNLGQAIGGMKSTNASVQAKLPKIQAVLLEPLENPGVDDFMQTSAVINQLLSMMKDRTLEADENLINQLLDARTQWSASFDYLPIDYVMDFLKDDNNIFSKPEAGSYRFFPSKGLIIPIDGDKAVASGLINEGEKVNCKDELRISFAKGGVFRSDVSRLTREEVMMLDVIANNEWERAIYYSSPYGSEVSKALYSAGALVPHGSVYALTPLKQGAAQDNSRLATYKLYMEDYKYGNLKGESVEADYYVRRHTNQYRRDFFNLASDYAEIYNKKYANQIAQLDMALEAGDASNEDSLRKQRKALNDRARGLRDTVRQILSKSMEEMPVDRVLDYSDPMANGALSLNVQVDGKMQRRQVGQNYVDGMLANYVILLYQVEALEEGDALAKEYLSQLETYVNFFEHSSAEIAYDNISDFVASTTNLLRTAEAVKEVNNNPELVSYANELNDRLNQAVSGIVAGLRDLERGRRTTGGSPAQQFSDTYAAMCQQIQGYIPGQM